MVGLINLRAGRTIAAQNPYVYDPDTLADPGVYTSQLIVPGTGTTVAANTLDQPHLVHPALTIGVNGGFRYVGATASAGNYTSYGKYFSRDQSYKGYTRNGVVYLRKTAAGKAFYFQFNGSSGHASCGIVTGLTPGTTGGPGGGGSAGTYTGAWSTTSLGTAGIGWSNGDTAGRYWFVYADGTEIGFKYFNGTTLHTIFAVSILAVDTAFAGGTMTAGFGGWLHMEDGTVAMTSLNDTLGHRDVTITYDETPTQYLSDFTSTIYPADFGVKELELTGSMTVSSSIFILDTANAGRFAVGDTVGIPVGYAAGGGQHGTQDIGGSWPLLQFANLAAAAANTTPVQGTVAYIIDQNKNYRLNKTGVGTGTIAGGSGYLNGTVLHTLHGGTGNPQTYKAFITTSGGTVTTVTTSAKGIGYAVNDVLTIPALPGGSGFSFTVTSLATPTWEAPQAAGINGSIGAAHYNLLTRVPKPLVAKITAIGGSGGTADKELTLGTPTVGVLPATVAVPAGTPIFFDNTNILNKFGLNTYGTLVPQNIFFKLPSGRIATCGAVEWLGVRTGWTIEGSGSDIPWSHWVYPGFTGETILYGPPGCSYGLNVKFISGTIQHLHIVGNGWRQKFGLYWEITTETSSSAATTAITSLSFDSTGGIEGNNRLINYKASDVGTKAAVLETSPDSRIEACYERNIDPQMLYQQWAWAFNNTDDSIIIDTESDNDYMRGAGCEPFRAERSTARRFVGRNYVLASNSSGDILFEDIRAKQTRLYQDVNGFGSPNTATSFFSINNNADGAGNARNILPKEAKGVVVDYGGSYINTDIAVDYQQTGIATGGGSGGVHNVEIRDSVFNMMPYSGAPGGVDVGALGVVSGAGDTGIVVDNVRVVGTTGSTGYDNIHGFFPSAQGVISNCQASSLFLTSSTLTNGGGNTVPEPANDTTPAAFTFTTLTGQTAGALVTSNTITLTGINQPLSVWTVTDDGDDQSAMQWLGSYGDTTAYRWRNGSDTDGNRAFPLKVNDALKLGTIAPPSGQTKIVTFTLNGVARTWSITSN